jgi:uncharacterized membrane protein YtjA (UPF0391 family)
MGPSCRREDKQPTRGVEGPLRRRLERPGPAKPLSLQQRPFGTTDMLKWALFFFIISIIAAIFGFTGIAAAAAGIAKILFFIFLVICVIFLVLGLMAGRAIL